MTLGDAVLLEGALRHGALLSPEQASESLGSDQVLVANVPRGLIAALRELAQLALTPQTDTALRQQVKAFELENAALKAEVSKLTKAVHFVLDKAKAASPAHQEG